MEHEKYGFVYLWRDSKKNKYYIGCHWGTEDDGYICSSSWMKRTYKNRPQDFKRRILSRVYTDKKDLMDEEYKYLSQIKSEELKVKYYNLNNHKHNHWSSNPDSRSINQKISDSWTEEKRNKQSKRMSKNNPMADKDIVKKRLVTWNSKERSPWNKGLTKYDSEILRKQGKEHSIKMIGKVSWNIGRKVTNETKRKISESQTGSLYYNNKKINIRLLPNDEIPEGFVRGRLKIGKCKKKIDRVYYYNPTLDKIISINKDETPPLGYHRGRK